MLSKLSRTVILGVLCCAAGVGTVYGQDMADFKARMSAAAAMTKVDMDEALRQYLEIRVTYAGPEVDYSLGRAYQRLAQCEQAQYYYTQVMVAYELNDANPIYQLAVNAFDKIAACGAWQRVKVSCDVPSGGYAVIDGERVRSCWDRAYAFEDGEHVFELYDGKGRHVERKVTTASGGEELSVSLAFEPERVQVEKVVEVERGYVYREKFHPALYWGLITGGAVVAAAGGLMSGFAGQAKAEEQKYSDLYALSQDEALRRTYDRKRKSANDDVKLGNILMYSLIGVGSAAVVTGIVLGVVSAVSDRERVDADNLEAYVIPDARGVSFGLGMRF